MQRLTFMVLALALLFGAMAPVFEAFDGSDTHTSLISDTEFQLPALAFAAAMAIATFLVVNRIFRLNCIQTFLSVVAAHLAFLPRDASFHDTSPPVCLPLRI